MAMEALVQCLAWEMVLFSTTRTFQSDPGRKSVRSSQRLAPVTLGPPADLTTQLKRVLTMMETHQKPNEQEKKARRQPSRKRLAWVAPKRSARRTSHSQWGFESFMKM